MIKIQQLFVLSLVKPLFLQFALHVIKKELNIYYLYDTIFLHHLTGNSASPKKLKFQLYTTAKFNKTLLQVIFKLDHYRV